MPKCLECGFISPRLQWTHFKYKCTGRFKNGQEYLKVYPDAKVVDEDLAKRTAVTLENLLQKYGEVEGYKRWQTYRQKQAESNTFEYKHTKHGWSAEQFHDYNKQRASTVVNFVNKYGLEQGLQKWEQYCDKQKITKSKEYVIEKYGQQAWYDLCLAKKTPHDPKLLATTYGISYDQAVDKILARSRLRYTSNLEREFISALEGKVGSLEYSSLGKPFGKWLPETNSYVIYDIKHQDCIIEFNGDYWHANPVIYSSTDIIRGKNAYDIWSKDLAKLNLVKDLGFRVKVVWEKDYLANKCQIIEEVAQWILDTQK